MNPYCKICGSSKDLSEGARYCDWCSGEMSQPVQVEPEPNPFDAMRYADGEVRPLPEMVEGPPYFVISDDIRHVHEDAFAWFQEVMREQIEAVRMVYFFTPVQEDWLAAMQGEEQDLPVTSSRLGAEAFRRLQEAARVAFPDMEFEYRSRTATETNG